MTNSNDHKPDVEKIIKQIRDDIQSSEIDLIPAVVESVEQDSDLGRLIADANRLFAIGQQRPKGIKGLFYKIAMHVMAPQIVEMNRINSLSIRIFNKLNMMLSGNDTSTESDLLAQTLRRIDLLTDLGKRIDDYERLDLDARLKRIEAGVSGTQD